MHRTEGTNAQVDALGRNKFVNGPPGTTVDAAWLNSIQEEIAKVIEMAGLSLATRNTDTRTQLWEAIQRLWTDFDYVVNSQETFNALVVRVAANRYQIKSGVKSVYMKTITGGYAMTGGSSPLASGDTWGRIETNECVLWDADPAAYIAFGATEGYIYANTANGVIRNIWNRGNSGNVAPNSTDNVVGFYQAAAGVRFENCRVSHKTIITRAAYGFLGNSIFTGASAYVNCVVDTITASQSVNGFRFAEGLLNCVAVDLTGTSVNSIIGFQSCQSLTNCQARGFLDSGLSGNYLGFSSCGRLTSCSFSMSPTLASSVKGFISCSNVSACQVTSCVLPASSSITGFDQCTVISGCSVTSISGSGSMVGFSSCTVLAGCYAHSIVLTTNNANSIFNTCSTMSACYIGTVTITGNGSLYGFATCTYLSACYVLAANFTSSAGTVNGYNACSYGAALYTNLAANASNTWMNTNDASIVDPNQRYSTPAIWT